jgi:hypothetical protein
MPHALYRRTARILLLPASFCALSVVCESQTSSLQTLGALCDNGFGRFSSEFTTGVTVSVGPVKNAAFSGRSCEAKFTWKNEDLVIMPQAAQIDIDVLGSDLGFGTPVVAFQTRKSQIDPLLEYDIYTLAKPPRKLRTLTGGNLYRAADTDLDGKIEIWTNDAAAIDGFEGFPLRAIDIPPTIVLRIEHQRLMDVSSEFQPDYDRQIANLRTELNQQELANFKSNDGKLSNRFSLPADQVRVLTATKIKILEIAWSYLYSGREADAWKTLAELWPASDVDRIRTAIVNARANGMHSRVDGISQSPSHFHKKHTLIYEAVLDPPKDDHMSSFDSDTMPQEILLRRPPPPDTVQAALDTEVVLNLVIDAAGKVRSATPEGKPDKELIDATADWRFIPAFKTGHAVASRMRFGVTPYK